VKAYRQEPAQRRIGPAEFLRQRDDERVPWESFFTRHLGGIRIS
jgi:hypothetical protein